MAELTMTAFLTLDGVMQAPGGPGEDESGGFQHGGWIPPHIDEQLGGIVEANFRKADAFLLGRRTYEIFASYWPNIESGDAVATGLNTLPKHVATRTLETFDWDGSSAVRDVVQQVPELKARYERELQVHGSSDLAQTLLENDLIDELRLMIFPSVVGSGKRLFGEGAVPRTLTLTHSETTSTGVVYAVYRRKGPLETASFLD